MLLATAIHKNGLGGQKRAIATALQAFLDVTNKPVYLVPVSINEASLEVTEMLHRFVYCALVQAQNHIGNRIK